MGFTGDMYSMKRQHLYKAMRFDGYECCNREDERDYRIDHIKTYLRIVDWWANHPHIWSAEFQIERDRDQYFEGLDELHERWAAYIYDAVFNYEAAPEEAIPEYEENLYHYKKNRFEREHN
jgi:hypothetical protein